MGMSIDAKLDLIIFFTPVSLDKVRVEELIREHEKLCYYTNDKWGKELDVDPITYIPLIDSSCWKKFSMKKHCGGYMQKYEEIWQKKYSKGRGSLSIIMHNHKKIGKAINNCNRRIYDILGKKGFNHKSAAAYQVATQTSFLFHKFMVYEIFGIGGKNPFDPMYELLFLGYSIKRLEDKWVVCYIPEFNAIGETKQV